MANSETRTLAGVPDRYDGLAALVVLSILAWAFLVAIQPLVGLLLTTAFVSAYAVARFDGLKHAGVVAGLWVIVIAAVWFVGTFLGFAVAAVFAVVCYGLWRGA